MNDNYTLRNQNKQNEQCAMCGFGRQGSFSFEQVLAGKFDNKHNGSFDAVRETPVRAAKVEPDVLVPLFQSLISAVVTTLPVVVVAMVFRWRWEAPLAMGAATVLISWFQSVSAARLSLCKVERFSYAAEDQSAAEVVATGGADPVRLEIISKDDDFKAAMKIVDLPGSVTAAKFISFSKDILAGKAVSRRNWTPRPKGFSRDEYDQLTDAMVVAGLLSAVPGEGKKLTAGGRRAIKWMVEEAQTIA